MTLCSPLSTKRTRKRSGFWVALPDSLKTNVLFQWSAIASWVRSRIACRYAVPWVIAIASPRFPSLADLHAIQIDGGYGNRDAFVRRSS